MFREVRRKNRQIGTDEIQRILSNATYGVLSVVGDDGYPYGVPVNYAYSDGKIYFHSTSSSSHKIDSIKKNSKVCFTVVTKHELVEQDYSTNYESVIVFGTARIVEESPEKEELMGKMMDVLAPSVKSIALQNCGATGYVMVEVTPQHVTGKAKA